MPYVIPHSWTTSTPLSSDRFQRLADNQQDQYQQRGKATLTFSAVNALNSTVTFPVAFAALPVISAIAQSSPAAAVVAYIFALSTTQMSIQVVTVSGAAYTGTVTLHWVAFTA